MSASPPTPSATRVRSQLALKPQDTGRIEDAMFVALKDLRARRADATGPRPESVYRWYANVFEEAADKNPAARGIAEDFAVIGSALVSAAR